MTKPASPEDIANAGQARLVGIVLAGTMILWLAGQWLGGMYGWQLRFAFLFDLAALAAFVWALVVTFRIWRRRNAAAQDN